MAAMHKLTSPSALILVAIGISVAAIAVLIAFPTDLHAWRVASWTLVAALAALLVLVVASACILATNRAARTWQRIASFLIGLGCLVTVAVGAI